MKKITILYLILLVFPVFSCGSYKITQTERVELYTYARGFEERIRVDHNTVCFSQKLKGEENKSSSNINENQWNNLINQLKEVYPIAEIEPPSTKHQVDADRASSLKIITPDTTYASKQFDAGNPPEELKAVISSLKRLSGVPQKTK